MCSDSYVELHLHTAYSFLDGASQPEELVGRARALGYAALAITDHDNLAGAMAFAQCARAANIQPIIGAELTLTSLPPSIPPHAGGGVAGVSLITHHSSLITHHLTLLVETRQGHANLCRLLTEAHDPGRLDPSAKGASPTNPRQWSAAYSQPPALPVAALEGRTDGLIALSGCRQGLLNRLIDSGHLAEAEAAARWLRELFGASSFFLELQRHLVRGDERRVRRLVELAERLASPIVATGDVHYHERDRHRLQDAMVAIKHRTTLEASAELRRPNSEFFLRSPAEMAEIFSDLPAAIHATSQIADRCQQFDLTKDLGYRFPEFRRGAKAGDVGAAPASSATPQPPVKRGAARPEVTEASDHAPAEVNGNDNRRRRLPPFHGGTEGGRGDRGIRDRHAVASDELRHPPQSPRMRGEVPPASHSSPITHHSSLLNQDDAPAVLEEFCWGALDQRYPAGSVNRAEAEKRLRDELKLIHKHRLDGFFLVYRDLLELAYEVAAEVRGRGRARGASGLPPGRGRGSSVSSIVCYLIGLSHIDPVKNRLFPGRFLNEALHSVPDIDLDFARDIREQLILRVYERYGPDHAALVCSFATYHIRGAVRDLGKVLGLPMPLLDKLAKLSEGGSAATVRTEMERLPEFRSLVDMPAWRHLMDLARQINQFPRHISQHVGGMIISSQPIIELVPVQPAAMPGRYICQWDKDSCDDARFIKVDFLALGMLSLVEECLELIWDGRGERVDLSQIDHSDTRIYDLICQGDTVGLFQIESRAQIQMLPRTQPRNLDDLAVQVAIVRPGPIVGGAVNPYVRQRERQRHGATDFAVDHPFLEEPLRDTLGVILFQDQVMTVAKALAGFTDGQADRLRRAMSRRRSRAAMESFWQEFWEGASGKGVDEATARKVFDKLVAFSEFGFPKSHAAAFAVLAYQSAWLRFHYPAEYLCALFNNQPMGFYAPHVLVGDARRHGIHVLPVDVSWSGVQCRVDYGVMSPESSWDPDEEDSWSLTASATTPLSPPVERGEAPPAADPSLITHHSSPGRGRVRLGLERVRGLGREAAEAIVAEREAGGPFRSLTDFVRRMAPAGLKRPAIENLILVGAFPSLGLNRRELLWQLGLLTQSRVPRVRDVGLRTASLALPTEQDMVERPAMDTWERIVADYHTLGLSPTLHPLGLMRSRLPENIVPAERLGTLPDGSMVRVAGVVVCRQRPGTAQGFTFLLIEDETGLANVIVRPPLYERQRPIVRREPMVIVRGRLQLRDGNVNVLAEDVQALEHTVLPTSEASAAADDRSSTRADNDQSTQLPLVVPIPDARSFH